MAEFKLGRIRFVWKADWTVGTPYYKDDVISYGGRTYLCVLGHTAAADFYTDLDVVPSRWNLFADGQEWKGEWDEITLYKENDLVKYGGFVYICTNGHTSSSISNGLEFDLNIGDSSLSKWELYAEGFEWRSNWNTLVRYRKNDIVKYGGNNYVCSIPHTSAGSIAAGLEANIANWTILSEGFDWKNDWVVDTRYKINDVVTYGGQAYICNQGHTSAALSANGLEADQSKWDYFHKGIEYKGDWSASLVRYKVNDLVKYGGGIWRCNTHHTSGANFSTVNFEQFVEGIEFESFWSSATVYQPGDIVRYGGFSYISKTVHSNSIPTNATNWDLFATSFKFEGDWGSGTAYLPGEVVRHGGYTYTSILAGTNQPPDTATTYWSRLNSGLRWRGEWLNSTSYLLGDIAKYNSSSYICILGHTSDDDDSTLTPTTNSPEKDVTGTYWNLLTSGLEESVLSTVGDLVYYAPNGPARLPIGEEGQILAVENGVPVWRNWGEVDKVFYVAPHGVDEPYPAYGVTIDRPWASVRYATEQIEKGTAFSSSAYLLNQNRTFIQKELTNWVVYQIANSIAPFAGFVNDSQALCERDIGLIVDAFVYDLTHGGNSKTIEATESYFTALGVIESFIADEEEQLVASINYTVNLIDKILSNLAPIANYQSLNGVSAGDRTKQIIDFTYDSENGASEIITGLAGVITSALTANSIINLPVLDVPKYTINVKTGQYYEVLPIYVPANTAINGDELRSTRISPAGSLIASNDKAKSVLTLQRLKSVTSGVVINSAVTPTTGNTASQNITSQKAGNTGSSTAVSRIGSNITEIKDIISNGLGAVDAFTFGTPTGWGSSLTNTAYASTGNVTGATTTYDFARAQILANTAFIKAEITAWIAVQVAGNIAPFTTSFTYDAAACARDVEYILDAVRYDITYGGNTQTRIAADAYYSYGEATFGSGEKAATLAAFARLKTVVGQVVTEAAVSVSAGNALTQDVSGTAGNASADNFAEEHVQQIIDTITADGVLPTLLAPATSWVSTELLTARTALNSLKATIQTDAVSYIKREYPILTFNETTCSRDVGYIVDSLGYDLMFDSNFASIKSGMAYRRGTSSALLVVANQLAATLGIIDFIGVKAKQIAASGAVVAADALWDYIINYVNTGTRPIVFGTNDPVTDIDLINGARILQLNKAFMVAEANAYIADTFKATVTVAVGATDVFTCSSQTWMVAGDTVRFTGTVFGGVNTTTTYYVLATGLTATSFKISTSLNGTAVDLSDVPSGSMIVKWYYSAARCENDVRNYVDAIAHDLIYTGNYDSTTAARYYRSAYTGSKLEDMFYVKNGCGVRNQTLTGLDGTSDGNTSGAGDADGLTPANEYGTQRPLAGSYVSLDPGWGPNDRRVWITNKSTYVQNVTTFGIACVGQKIDGSLHAGGNDSIVSNDFTQVLSDGIGAWITNLGRAELVSVFSYYNHIGYLAENGGKIRATNGNNSYGKFGSVAEGYDVLETPVTGQVDNQRQEANVRTVLTDGTQVLAMEYLNAGQNYETATYTILGAGTAAAVSTIETRNGGVFQVRLTDPGDSTGPGGVAYVTAANVAQDGNTTQITLAAADSALSTAYVGMHIFITAGTGAGQYGYIATYNNGSKIATVRKESDGTTGWDHLIPGTPIVAALDLTTGYEITPRLTFSDPGYTKTVRSLLAARNWNDAIYGNGYASYSAVAATGGAGSSSTFDIVRTKGTYTVTINNPGFNFVVGDVLTIAGTAVGGTAPANTISITVDAIDVSDGSLTAITSTGTAIAGAYIAVGDGTNKAGYSVDGITWSEVTLPSTGGWQSVVYGVYSNIGKYVAIVRDGTSAAHSVDGVTWTSSTISEGGDWVGLAYGNSKFVAISESDSGTTSRAVSSDGGATWSVGTVATGAKAIAFGNGRFVIVEGNFSNSVAWSTDGVTWTVTTLPANTDSSESNWYDIAFGNGRFVAIADNATMVAYSFNGATWYASTLPVNADWRKIAYGSGVFLALADGEIAASSHDGKNWTSRSTTIASVSVTDTAKDDSTAWATGTLSSVANWNSIGYGNSKYVAVSAGPLNVAYSTNGGLTWTAGTIPLGSDDGRCVAYGGGVWVIPYAGANDVATSTDGITFTFQTNVLTVARDWSAITYGNGYFVMVQTTGTTTAQYSTNGTTWSAGVLPSADEWTSVAYGNISGTNYFVAVSGGTTNSTAGASSVDNGATWTARTLPTSTRWSSVTFGNSTFVAVAGNSGTTTTSAAYSTNGTTWTASTLPGAAARWTNVTWNGTVFVATAYSSNRSAVSEDGITWTEITMTTTANWTGGASDGAFNTVVVATGSSAVRTQFYQANTNYLTVASTADLSVNDTVQFSSGVIGGVVGDTRYFVKSIASATRFNISSAVGGSALTLSTGSGTMAGTVGKLYSAAVYGNPTGNAGFITFSQGGRRALNVYAGTRARARAWVVDGLIREIWMHEPGSNYTSAPTMTIVDPNNTGADATHTVRIANGVLAQPNYSNRGTGYTASSVTLTGDGYADNYQIGAFVEFKGLTDVPRAGANLQIAGIDDVYYRIVNIRNLLGVVSYTAQIQVSPDIGSLEAPEHETATTIRRRYSQVRLTGHDFLDIGTGNQTNTNYPGLPVSDPIPANETVDSNGGRVFFTSTDQDGNFRVGGLFNVEQSTGTATLNVDAFNLSGLNELSLGELALGGSGATITEFSTDPFFTSDSDSVIPTQRAIKAYISSQIGGGGSSLNVNTLTAGVIFIAGQEITTTTNVQININSKLNFAGGVDGYPVALNLFLQA